MPVDVLVLRFVRRSNSGFLSLNGFSCLYWHTQGRPLQFEANHEGPLQVAPEGIRQDVFQRVAMHDDQRRVLSALAGTAIFGMEDAVARAGPARRWPPAAHASELGRRGWLSPHPKPY